MILKQTLSISHLIPLKNSFRHFIPQCQRFHNFTSQSEIAVASNLIKSYCMEGDFNYARCVFDAIPHKDIVAWTSMISGYTMCGRYTQAWMMFCEMKRKEDFELSGFPISSTLKACKGIGSTSCGSMVHGVAIKSGLECNVYVENALLDMYATCKESMDDACMVFESIRFKNAVSWTTMIAGYTHRGEGYAALQVFEKMIQEEVELNPFTITISIRACSSIGSLELGRQLHATVTKHGFESNIPVGNALVDMYCRCSRLSEAYNYFHELPDRDLITWNTMIAGFEKSGSDKSLALFSQLSSEDLCPNCFTFSSVVSSCANLAVLSCGQQIHGGIIRRGFQGNLALANSLLDMYAKCGSIADSCRVFIDMPQRDVISWTSMMNGYGSHGYGTEAIRLFNEMVRYGIKPDVVVFMGVLSACSHSGLVEEGLGYYKSMSVDYRIKASQEIYGCVVDLLGRAGRVNEAYELILAMPFEPDESVWGALFSACKAHKVSFLGQLAAEKILELRPKGAETYVMLSNIYAADGKWGEFAKTRKLMRGTCDKKVAGRSWIEVRDQIYTFVVADKVGPEIELIYDELKRLFLNMKEEGYAPDVECLARDYESLD